MGFFTGSQELLQTLSHLFPQVSFSHICINISLGSSNLKRALRFIESLLQDNFSNFICNEELLPSNSISRPLSVVCFCDPLHSAEESTNA